MSFAEDRVYVKVLKALGNIVEIDITTGLSANAYTVVTGGDLQDGDELLINLPDVGDDVMDQFNSGPGSRMFGGGN